MSALSPGSGSRQNLTEFIIHFFLINIALSFFIFLNYINVLKPLFAMGGKHLSIDIFIGLFVVISYIAQMTILFFSCCLCLLVLSIFFPNRKLIFVLAVLSSSMLFFSLTADSVVFNLFHMHYAELALQILKASALGQVISFSFFESFELISGIILFILFESVIAILIWRALKIKAFNRWSYVLAGVFIICAFASYSFNFMARSPSPFRYGMNTDISYLLIKATRFIPYYNETYRFVMNKDEVVKEIQTMAGAIPLQVRDPNLPLAYPKQILQCESHKTPLNIVVITIDTWRFDAMNEKVTPNIYQFAKKSSQFTNHWSGGNCTQSGLFTFFYGLPPNYWQAFLNQQKGPELIKQLLKANYRMGIFASAQLNFPAFDQTIFLDVKPLKLLTKGETSVARDREITQEFKQFLTTRNKEQPFFSFLFYDAAHNYCESTPLDEYPFNPWVKACNRMALTKNMDPTLYMNRYKNAVHFVDSQVKLVLQALEQQDLLKNTIIIITADHGEEINDNHSGYWQHTSAYTSYQLHIPMIVHWPKQEVKTYPHFTTHYDIVPTLMTEVLQCKNQPETYTTGKLLFKTDHRLPFISGSYSDYAIISKNQVLRIYQNGDYAIEDKNGQPIGREPIVIQPLQQAYKELNNYFR